jgi:hypothetical protein
MYGNTSAGALTLENVEINPGNQTLTIGTRTFAADNGGMGQLLLGSQGLSIGADGISTSGYGSFALGAANVTGNYAIAIGWSFGWGYGFGCGAWGNYSIALNNAEAVNDYSFALGSGASANANYAIACGSGTGSSTWATVAIGHEGSLQYSYSGNTTAWQATDPAFFVAANLTNYGLSWFGLAMVIQNNGNVTMNGAMTITNPDFVSATSTTQPTALQINGAALVKGQTALTGNVALSQTVGAEGDVPMGSYGIQP